MFPKILHIFGQLWHMLLFSSLSFFMEHRNSFFMAHHYAHLPLFGFLEMNKSL